MSKIRQGKLFKDTVITMKKRKPSINAASLSHVFAIFPTKFAAATICPNTDQNWAAAIRMKT